MSDFEKSFFGAFTDVVTYTKIRGCFFTLGLGQYIWQKIQTIFDICENIF